LEPETLHEIPFGLTETFLNSLSVEFSRKNRFPLPSSRTALMPAVCNVLSFVAASQLYPVYLACWYQCLSGEALYRCATGAIPIVQGSGSTGKAVPKVRSFSFRPSTPTGKEYGSTARSCASRENHIRTLRVKGGRTECVTPHMPESENATRARVASVPLISGLSIASRALASQDFLNL
jgi:hypothetical protein